MPEKRQALWIVLLLGCSLGAAGRDEPLLTAARTGDTKALRTLIQERANVNAREADGTTALHLAVLRDDIDAVDLLLRGGADPKAADRYGVTPLTVACINGNAGIIERLVKAGADPNTALATGETALMTASRTGKVDAVKILLAYGANVNASENARGQTALMWAAASNNTDAINVLIDAGAEVLARSHGPKAAVPAPPKESELDRPADQNAGYAAKSRRGRLDSFTPLLFAARDGATDAVRTLLDRGANVNDKVEDGTSALVVATMNAHWELASYLLDRGADPNAAEQGWTALHQLVRTRGLSWGRLPHPVGSGKMSSIEFAKRLIEHGADVNARMTKAMKADNERPRIVQVGATAFLLAAKSVDHEMMRLLADHGVDPLIKTGNHTTALMLAAGVQIFSIGEDSGTNEDALKAVTLCLDLGNDVNAVDDNGETALHGAAWRGANEIVKLLVERGARLDAREKKGNFTPLAYAHLVYTPGMVFQSWPETEALLRKMMEDRGLPTDVPTPEDLRKVLYSAGAAAPR